MPSQKHPPEDRAPRSRAYPLLSLKEVCDLLQQKLSGWGGEWQSREDLAIRLGYSSGGGGVAARKVASLAHYGALARHAGGYVLSERGRHLQRLPPHSGEYKRLLRSALEEPALFRRILERYRPVGQVPDSAELAPVLTGHEFGITGTASVEAAEVFWQSALFAGVLTWEGFFLDPPSQEPETSLPEKSDSAQGKEEPDLLTHRILLPKRRTARLAMPAEFDEEDVRIISKSLLSFVDDLRAHVGLGSIESINRSRPRPFKNDRTRE